jgi:hypothetical protein
MSRRRHEDTNKLRGQAEGDSKTTGSERHAKNRETMILEKIGFRQMTDVNKNRARKTTTGVCFTELPTVHKRENKIQILYY